MDNDVLTQLLISVDGLQSALLALMDSPSQPAPEKAAALKLARAQLAQQQTTLRNAAGSRRMAVERLDIEEPDGTTRVAITNKHHVPPIIVAGKSHDERKGDAPAGLIFYDDEGSECGGLGFTGRRAENGKFSAYGGLMFDQFQQDQVIGIMRSETNGEQFAALQVWDRPNVALPEWIARARSIMDLPDGAEKTLAIQQFQEDGLGETRRLLFGKHQGNAYCSLSDGKGRVRLNLVVEREGAARIEFLDAAGAVTRTIGPDSTV